MKYSKKIGLTILTFAILLCALFQPNTVYAKNYDEYIKLRISQDKMTIYLNEPEERLSLRASWSGEYSSECQKQYDKMMKNVTWTTSDPSVVQFMESSYYKADGSKEYQLSKTYKSSSAHLVALKKGKVTVTATFKDSSLKVSCEINVKKSELVSEDEVFYSGNSYDFFMKGDAKAVSFSTSDTKLASINKKTGKLKAKKAGTVTVTCLADNGYKYTKRIKIKKAGLNYDKITSYYFTGLYEGYYSNFPIVAEGINVKSWKSSDEKVVKVVQDKKANNIGKLEIHSTGKCTVTCTAKDGKTYECAVTIVGGKKWSGLSNGYAPDISEVKKHGYYDDINKIQDYGNIIYYIVDYNKQIDYKNGQKKKTVSEAEDIARRILENRYPNKDIYYSGSGDLLGFYSGDNYGRLWCGVMYVEK